ncbi:MAG: HEAT repeat domain-containing protein [Myxococcota bacterium]
MTGALCLALAGSAHAADKNQKKALSALKSGTFQARIDALALLSRSKEPEAFQAVLAALKDKDATVRWAACEALEAMGNPEAIPALEEASKDASPLVAARAREAAAALKNATPGMRGPPVVQVQAVDKSGVGIAGLDALLGEKARAQLGRSKALQLGDPDGAGYLVQFNVQKVAEKKEGAETVLEVVVTATVQELPGHQLRFATRVGAAAGKTGPLSDAARKELANEILVPVSEALADEVAGYFAQRQ